jgi:hypothetical protein
LVKNTEGMQKASGWRKLELRRSHRRAAEAQQRWRPAGKKRRSTAGRCPREREREIMIQERLERGKGAWAHREVMGVLGRAKGRPERPNFAGDPTGKRGPYHRFLAARVDSSCGDDPGGKEKSMESFSCRGRAPEYGAMVRLEVVAFGGHGGEVGERER